MTGFDPWQRMPLEKLRDILQDRAHTKRIRDSIWLFLAKNGRRPRMLLSSIGGEGRQRIIKLLATSFARMGFDVDISPERQTPAQAARMAIENDVHIVCFLSVGRDDRRLSAQLVEELNLTGGEKTLVVGFSPQPPASGEAYHQAGIAEIVAFDNSMARTVLRIIDTLKLET